MEGSRYGSRSGDVMLLQLALRRAGRYPFALDGVFGTRTLNALRRFQSAQGLAPTGCAGKETLAALEPFLLGARRVKLGAGDTFSRLARRYSSSPGAIMTANPGLDPERAKAGEEAVIPMGFPLVSGDTPFFSELAEYTARGLVLRYPFIKAEPIGRSVSGRPIPALLMGEGAPVLLNAAHHANEWIAALIVYGFIERYAEAVVRGGDLAGHDARGLNSKARLCAVPLVNPDGADLVTGYLSSASPLYKRAAEIAEGYPEIPFPAGWKANIEGVDLNLNYPAGWERAREIKRSLGFSGPAPRDWAGEAPLSAVEARSLYEFTARIDPALTLSFHTQGGEIYYKFGSLEPENARSIGEKLAEASGYPLAEVPEGSDNAGFKDWFILNYGRPGFTVEAGRGENPLPLSCLRALEAECFPLIAAALAAAGEA